LASFVAVPNLTLVYVNGLRLAQVRTSAYYLGSRHCVCGVIAAAAWHANMTAVTLATLRSQSRCGSTVAIIVAVVLTANLIGRKHYLCGTIAIDGACQSLLQLNSHSSKDCPILSSLHLTCYVGTYWAGASILLLCQAD